MKKYALLAVFAATLIFSVNNTALAQAKQDDEIDPVAFLALSLVLTPLLFPPPKKKEEKEKEAALNTGSEKPSAFSFAPFIEQNRLGGQLIWRF